MVDTASASPIEDLVDQPMRALHERLLNAWNARDAKAMAMEFAIDGSMVGFDGSTVIGRGAIEEHLSPIFRDHPTARFVWKVRDVRALGPDASLLLAVAGMVPPGADDIKPERNAIQSLVARKSDNRWLVAHFQNTPAAGRPDEAEALTAELRSALGRQP